MKSQLLIGNLDDSIVAIESDDFDVELLCAASPDHPDRNEDAIGVWTFSDGSLVMAVADGMGGTPAGQLASKLAIERLDTEFAGLDGGCSKRSPILDAFEAANRDVLESAPGSGTTLVAVEVVGASVRTYNVGDSGALLVGQRGKIKIETTPHSPVGYGVAAGLIDAESAMVHEDRHYLSNHVGSKEMQIEMGIPRESDPLDTLLLASDGLFDNLAPAEIIDTIRCGGLHECVAALGHNSLASMRAAQTENGIGKPDDRSIVLARRRRG